MRRSAIILAVLTAVLAGFYAGRQSAESPTAHMNDLMSVGFRIYDPDGYEIDRWDN